MDDARLKGNACFKAGDLEGAVKEYQVGIDLYKALPKDEQKAVGNVDEISKSLGNQVMCLHRAKKYSECVTAAEKAIEINPFLAKAHGFLGMALLDGCNTEVDALLGNAKTIYKAHTALSRGVALLPDLQASIGGHLDRARKALSILHKSLETSSPAGSPTNTEGAKSSDADISDDGGEFTHVKSSGTGCGRGVFAKKALPPGTTVARMSNPFSVALYDKTLSTSVCHHCGLVAPERQFIVCNTCKSVAYCSETCAAKYAMRHSLECDKFVKLNEIIVAATNREIDMPEDFEEIASHVITTISGIKMKVDGYQKVQDLEGHDDAVVQSLNPMAPMMWELYDEEPQPFVSHIIGVVRSNSLQLNDTSGFPAGEGLFASNVCMFNHSCAPNCAIDVVSRTIRPTRVIDEGEELTISYIPQLFWPKRDRIEGLAERFFFTCRCERCRIEDPFEKVLTASVAGARPEATNFFHPLVQNVCGSIRSRHVEDVDAGAEKELADLTERAVKELHPLHYLLHDLRNTTTFVKTVLEKKPDVFASCMSELSMWECLVPGALSVKMDKLNCALLACDQEQQDGTAAADGDKQVALVLPKDVTHSLGGSYFGTHVLEYASIYKF